MGGQRLYLSVGRLIPSIKSGTSRVFSVYVMWLILLATTAWLAGQVSAETDTPTTSDTADTMVWPMLPGESVNQLAALFFPGDKAMQRRFAAKTRELSAEMHPELDATASFTQPAILVIPDIKALSREANQNETGAFNRKSSRKPGKRDAEKLQMSYRIRDAGSVMVTPEMEAEYESLSKRNQSLKDNLQKLNAKLARLQLEMETMLGRADGTRSSAVTVPAASMPETPVPVAGISSQAPVAPAQVMAQTSTQPLMAAATVKAQEIPTIKAEQIAPLTPAITKPISEKPAAEESMWLDDGIKMLLIQFALLVIGLILALFAWRWLRKQLARKITKETDEQLDGLRKNTFSADESGFFNTQQPYHIEDEQLGVLSVEEFDSVVDEARILVSMDRTNEAISLLLHHIEEQPRSSLQPWVYLLDVYRSLDKRDEFNALAKRFHLAFNVMAPQWENKQVAMVVATTLEEFPHIVDQLLSMWPSPDTKDYLEALIKDNREGERAGFNIEVAKEIALLISILEIRED